MATVENPKKAKKSINKKVTLVVNAGEAKEVVVTGEFTDWKESGIQLARGHNGDWQGTLELPPGEYQYRLRIDGEWRDHAAAVKRVPNPFGTENDVLIVG